MASKSKGKGRGRGKKKDQEEEKENALAFKVLTSSQTKELVELENVDDVQSKIAEFMGTAQHEIDLKDAAILDYYTSAVWWGREQNFSIEALSSFFTVVHNALNNIKDKQMTLVDSLKEFKNLAVGVGIQNPENSGGLDCLTVQQMKDITDYMHKSIFQHYKMYEYMFSCTQAEEIIGTDLDVELAPAGNIPWPPPLEEGICEEIFSSRISKPEQLTNEEEIKEDESQEAITADDTVDKDKIPDDLLNQFSPDEVKEIMSSVMNEMMQGLETDVAQKLKEKENAFLTRINKIHRVSSN